MNNHGIKTQILSNKWARLARLHQPIGIILLAWPCWWTLTLASPHMSFSTFLLFLVFTVGAIVMRSAGCIINDILDRHIDAQVERTKTRPIASGEVSVKQALLALAGLLVIAFLLLLLLGKNTVILGSIVLIPIALYPLAKRFTVYPQVLLGCIFNWGVLMAWDAVKGQLDIAALLLYFSSVAWTVGYDTIYAHQDKEDDAKIGVKSTALLWGDNSIKWLSRCYKIMVACIAIAGGLLHLRVGFYLFGIFAVLQLFWQLRAVKLEDPASCNSIFRSNAWFGLLVFISLLLGKW